MSFLGIRIPADLSRLLSAIDVPGEKEDLSSLHITILCFEENWAISEIAQAMEATYDVVHNFKPFLVKSNCIDFFTPQENNPYPIFAKIDSKELSSLNEELKKEFNKRNINFSKTYKDYKPHITLSYSKEKPESFDIDEVDFYVHELVLFGGENGDDRLFITFPLKCPERKKNSSLLNKIDNFYKISLF